MGGSKQFSEAAKKAQNVVLAAQKDKDSFEIYGNGRKRAEMDGNGWKRMQMDGNKPKLKPDQGPKSI